MAKNRVCIIIIICMVAYFPPKKLVHYFTLLRGSFSIGRTMCLYSFYNSKFRNLILEVFRKCNFANASLLWPFWDTVVWDVAQHAAEGSSIQFLYETLGSYIGFACLMGYYVLLAVPMAKASSHLLALFSV